VTELDRGSWVIFELPGFTTAASGTPQDSLDALRQASDTSYYKGQDSLWVKVVSNGDAGNGAPGGGTSVQAAGRRGPCRMASDPCGARGFTS
jgi:cell migration-inducing and hyaluronan-binding protein